MSRERDLSLNSTTLYNFLRIVFNGNRLDDFNHIVQLYLNNIIYTFAQKTILTKKCFRIDLIERDFKNLETSVKKGWTTGKILVDLGFVYVTHDRHNPKAEAISENLEWLFSEATKILEPKKPTASSLKTLSKIAESIRAALTSEPDPYLKAIFDNSAKMLEYVASAQDDHKFLFHRTQAHLKSQPQPQHVELFLDEISNHFRTQKKEDSELHRIVHTAAMRIKSYSPDTKQYDGATLNKSILSAFDNVMRMIIYLINMPFEIGDFIKTSISIKEKPFSHAAKEVWPHIVKPYDKELLLFKLCTAFIEAYSEILETRFGKDENLIIVKIKFYEKALLYQKALCQTVTITSSETFTQELAASMASNYQQLDGIYKKLKDLDPYFATRKEVIFLEMTLLDEVSGLKTPTPEEAPDEMFMSCTGVMKESD